MQIESVKNRKAKNAPSVFSFVDFKDYLQSVGFPEGKYQHSANTLERWSKRLGYKSPSSLTMVLKGQRLPSMEMIQALIEDIDLSGDEKDYFLLLIELERLKRKNKSTTKILEKLKAVSQNKSYFSLSLTQFTSISSWYHLVIRQVFGMHGTKSDLNWLAKRLRKKVTPQQIHQAISNLSDLGLIVQNKAGQYEQVKESITTTNDIPSDAIKMHHEGMIERAKEALYEQTLEERQFSAATFKLDLSQLAKAKREVFEFTQNFSKKYGSETGTEVYQLNIQLFSHTKAPVAIDLDELTQIKEDFV